MPLTSLGDAAQSFQLRLRNTALTRDLNQLTQELSTGRAADVAAHLKGNLAGLAGLERSLALLDTYGEATARATLQTSIQQDALGRLDVVLSDTATDFLRADGSGGSADLAARAVAAGRFEQAIDLLNTSAAGRAVFAGDSPDTSPLSDADAILDALRPLAAGASDAADLMASLEAWFLSPGSDFDAIAYQGGTGPAPAIRLSADTSVPLGPDARNTAIRQALMGLAMGALIGDGSFTAGEDEVAAARRMTGDALLSAQGAVIETRAGLGVIEARIETTAARNAATQSRYEIERNRLVSADPYETATRLQAVETQLEGLYVLTARLSRLSLTEFLR